MSKVIFESRATNPSGAPDRVNVQRPEMIARQVMKKEDAKRMSSEEVDYTYVEIDARYVQSK